MAFYFQSIASLVVAVSSLLLLVTLRLWFAWSLNVWTGPLERLSVHLHVVLFAWCYWGEFFSCRSRFQPLFHPVCEWVGAILLHWFRTDRFHRQTVSCKAVGIQWTLTIAGCQFLLPLLLHHCIICKAVIPRWIHKCHILLHYIFFFQELTKLYWR